jgi:hypothetical protein
MTPQSWSELLREEQQVAQEPASARGESGA